MLKNEAALREGRVYNIACYDASLVQVPKSHPSKVSWLSGLLDLAASHSLRVQTDTKTILPRGRSA